MNFYQRVIVRHYVQKVLNLVLLFFNQLQISYHYIQRYLEA
ncbi:hypothetical protein [Thiomicrorhabdus sp.]|nr:hypothetical protein [Thiomicrorhabdus sp.]